MATYFIVSFGERLRLEKPDSWILMDEKQKWKGIVVNIFITPEAGAPMQAVEAARA